MRCTRKTWLRKWRSVRASFAVARITAAALLVGPLGAAMAQPALPSLRLGHGVPQGTIQRQGLEGLRNQLAAEAIARIELVEIPAARIASGALTNDLRKGKIDIAILPLSILAGVSPRFAVFRIPFLFRDQTHVLRFQVKIGPDLLRGLREVGLEGIEWWPGDFIHLASRKPVLEPGDLRGLKILSVRSDRPTAGAAELFVQKTGASLVDAPVADYIRGFGQGEFDVIEGTVQDFIASGIPDLSITLTNHLYAGYALVANPARWSDLPAETREALKKEIRGSHDRLQSDIQRERREALAALQSKQGASIFPVSEALGNEWSNALRSESLTAAAGPKLVHAAESLRWWKSAARPGDEPELSWNTWLEDSQGRDISALALNKVSRINLDLARYGYREEWSAPGAAGLIGKLRDQGELKLILQPVLVGTSLTPAPGRPLAPGALTIRFDRTKPEPSDRKLLEAFRKGNLSTRALSEAVNLGSTASWDVVANQAGCGGLAISVWDEARIIPLDHIVISFPVEGQSNSAKACRPYGLSQGIGAGLETLLVGTGPDTGEGRLADAALHVFEIQEGTTQSIAVFVDRARLTLARNNPGSNDAGVYAWKLASVLSTYVSEQSQLPGLIKAAHEAISQPAVNPYPFEDVASELALKVFGGAFDQDRAEAAKAQAALKELVRSTQDPVVVFRLVSAAGKAVYLPFGLLAAQAREPVVPRRFTVVQPLLGRTTASSACIDRWWVARPPELQGVTGDARNLLKQAASRPEIEGMSPLKNHDALARYLNGSSVPPGAPGGEGLILLAHHYNGNLQFSEEDRPPGRIAREFISRAFPPGSVAILAACSTTGKDLETSAIAEQLERRGVETLILSPFAVNADFGTRLALEFEQVVVEERARRSGATVLQVFGRAVDRVSAAFKNQAALRDMSLEFQIVGNPDIRLCK